MLSTVRHQLKRLVLFEGLAHALASKATDEDGSLVCLRIGQATLVQVGLLLELGRRLDVGFHFHERGVVAIPRVLELVVVVRVQPEKRAQQQLLVFLLAPKLNE